MTQADFELLTQYKEQMHTALHSNYARYVPRRVLERMVKIIKGTNAHYRMNASCPRCTLSILTDAGRIYEKEVQQRINNENNGESPKSKTKKVNKRASQRDGEALCGE